MSLSSSRRTEAKKLINGSYLNDGVDCVFESAYLLHIDPGEAVKRSCVNNRCIRSKFSGDQGMALAVDGLNWVVVEQWYNPGWDRKSAVGEKMLEWEPCHSRGWAPRRPFEQPWRTGKKGCDSQKSGGQYVTVLFSLQLTSHTIISFVTLSNPFNKVRGIFF